MADIIRSVFSKWWGFMSCAFWTFLGLWILLKNPSANTQVKAYFALAGFSLLCALLQTIHRLYKEVKILNALPPAIKITIEDVVMHRTGDEEWRWKNGEFLVQVSAELLNLPSSVVEYSAQLIFRGEIIQLTAIKDVEKWEILERKYCQQLYPNTPSMSRPRKDFVTNPAAITQNLTRSIRNEGWLHFQIEGMREQDIARRTLRLYATSESGGCHVDEALAEHHVVRSDLAATRKYIPKQP